MDDKMSNKAIEEKVDPKAQDEAVVAQEETEEAVHTLEQDEALRDALLAEIEDVQEKTRVLTGKLCIAKDKGMHEQADRCRTMLQRVVLFRRQKEAELKEVEERIRKAKALAFMESFSREVDDLTNEIEKELFGLDLGEAEPDHTPLFEAEYDHKAKAKRLSFISSLFVWVGLLSSMLGAIAYLLLTICHYMAFSWMELSLFGGVLVITLIFALIFGSASNRHKRLAKAIAEEIEERRAEYEAERLERERKLEQARKISQVESFDGIAEAYEIEKKEDQQRTVKKKVQTLMPDLSDPEKIKKTLNRVLPIVAAVAVVTAALVTKKHKKKKLKKTAEQEEAAIRRALLERLR